MFGMDGPYGMHVGSRQMKLQLVLLSTSIAVVALGVLTLHAGQTVAAPTQVAVVAALTDEAAFMRDLRALANVDAELTIERAREGGARFGASADAPERRSISIHALTRMGLVSEARGEAEAMVNECPDSSWVREVERLTGARRHRNMRLAADGQLEYGDR
jgi:hypothetical protein